METLTTLDRINNAVKSIDFLIGSVRSEIKLLQAQIQQYTSCIDSLNNKKITLSVLESQLKKEAQEKQDKQLLLVEKLNKVVNLADVLKAINTMSRTIKIRRASAKAEFWEAQKVIENAAKSLREVGLVSKGLDELAMSNYNRKDLYNFSIELEDILNLKEIETSED